MKSPQEMEEDVDHILSYMTIGVICLLVTILLMIGVEIAVGLLTTISIGG